MIRLRGNEAAHDHHSDQTTALAALITAHRLSVWFQRTFADPAFSPGPFRPLIAPSRANKALREEVDAMRSEVARYEEELATTKGEIVQYKSVVQSLEAEARRFKEESKRFEAAKEESEAERNQFERELERIRQQASRTTPADLESFIERARRASVSLSRTGVADESVPIARIRFRLGRNSQCHDAPLLLAQSMKGGVVRASYVKCRRAVTVTQSDFQSLDLWISCPRCPVQRLDAATVGSGNYGFKCPQCGWQCLLASLLPNWDELF